MSTATLSGGLFLVSSRQEGEDRYTPTNVLAGDQLKCQFSTGGIVTIRLSRPLGNLAKNARDNRLYFARLGDYENALQLRMELSSIEEKNLAEYLLVVSMAELIASMSGTNAREPIQISASTWIVTFQ